MSDFPDDTWLLVDVRAWLRDHVEDGASCPCCTQFAKVYYRKVNSGMVLALVKMYVRGDFVHVSELRSHEVAQLSWWGLAEEEPRVRADGGRIGWWRITDDGCSWLLGRSTIPTYARIYDGRLLGLTGPQRTATEAVRDKFDLTELLRG